MAIFKRNLFLIALFVFTTTGVQAQNLETLSLERIFSSEEFSSERFGPARWLRDGSGYTTLERADGGGRDIVRYSPDSGAREVIISASNLTPEGAQIPLRIANYTWSSDGNYLLIFTNTRRVWRQNTRGDYWLYNLTTEKLRRLGADFAEATLMFAKFSPENDKVGYVQKNNLYVEDIETGKITQLTFDGSETIINGTFDWVYEEEFGLRDGFRWSPDGSTIAFWQLDAAGVGEFYMINNTDSLYSRIIPVQYPKVGTTNSACRVGAVSADGGQPRWFSIPGDPRNNYIARMEWAADSREVMIQYLNRLQNTNRIMFCTAVDGNARTILTERDDAWLDVVDEVQWLENSSKFTWVSERDGWRHVCVVSRSGREIKAVTSGAFDVISVEKIDERGGWLYYMASPDNATQRYLYRVRLNGKGQPQRLSPLEQPGSHSYQISEDGKWAFHTYSTFDTPAVIELVRLPSHELKRTLVDNRTLLEKVEKLRRRPVEFFRVDIGDGVLLDGYVMRPPDFDPGKKYPVLFYVYGEPAGQTVLDRWSGSRYLWHLLLTQKGYCVMSVDNRGTPAPRGREWRKCVYRQIGVLASADQAAAVRLIREWEYVDENRIGVWGWSGGGSMTLNALFRYPDLYHTGISVAPVSNQRYYDTIYQERYMGLPKENVQGYTNGSPITFAHQLEGNLLLVHGTGDDNVHYQNAEAVINELIRHNKQFTMMSYPNRSHGINEGANTTRHLYELLTNYLLDNLPPGGR